LAARQRGLGIGAHPSYPDRDNFGRVAIAMALDELAASIEAQLRHFERLADECGAEIAHVKPHGALYNVAALDSSVAGAIADAVAAWRPCVILVGLAGSVMLDVFRERGFRTAAEAFVDRRYEGDGTLTPRTHPDALLTDPDRAAEQSVALAGRCDTLCIHSDTPNSVAIAAAVRGALEREGVVIRPLLYSAAAMAIRVEKKSEGTYEVKVEGTPATTHSVTVSPDYYQKLTGGKVSPEVLIERSFEFLLERESNTSILRSFDLPVIQRYFPEYERTVAKEIF
jgi:UPF0271 protein